MIKKIILSVFTLAILVACSSDDSSSGATSDGFDRQAMLTNWADNIIIPALQDLSGDLAMLTAAKDAFVAAPDQTTLDAVRSSWLEAYKTWQYVEMFDIGKAEELEYWKQMNIYPTNVTNIQNNISSGSGSYNLASPSNNASVGFPAVDYLLYGIASSDIEILNIYTNSSNFESNKTYLSNLIDRMQSLTDLILNDWTSNYRTTFINGTANTATSSVNKIVNDFNFYYEKGLRANKFGIPSGVFSTTPFNDKVEAFYNQDVSKDLALEAFKAVQDFFNGEAYDNSSQGLSFKDYLDYLNTIKNGEDLNLLINNQFDIAETKIQTLNNNFSLQIETDNTKMLETYDEIQKAVVLLKVDMMVAFQVAIDDGYDDNDGD
ncbi:imelysin family protein [Psychroserpens damuponensis]|uniref:imelysin family protein n=1 Tax=Psychroserpens damuponensis TaxID=943936 RepID=UPI00058AE72D|nr:imelysin family protein [Psychroserpens damuponensis]